MNVTDRWISSTAFRTLPPLTEITETEAVRIVGEQIGLEIFSEQEKGGARMSDFDPVNKPKHYTNTKVECIDAMIALYGVEAVKAFCVCNAFKYHWRANDKNGQEDLDKADWYMQKYKELVNG